MNQNGKGKKYFFRLINEVFTLFRRRKPGRSGSKRPGRPQSRPSSDHDAEMTNHPSHNDHLEEENFNRFAHDGPKPSPVRFCSNIFAF